MTSDRETEKQFALALVGDQLAFAIRIGPPIAEPNAPTKAEIDAMKIVGYTTDGFGAI